jgi:hypothetical protein
MRAGAAAVAAVACAAAGLPPRPTRPMARLALCDWLQYEYFVITFHKAPNLGILELEESSAVTQVPRKHRELGAVLPRHKKFLTENLLFLVRVQVPQQNISGATPAQPGFAGFFLYPEGCAHHNSFEFVTNSRWPEQTS